MTGLSFDLDGANNIPIHNIDNTILYHHSDGISYNNLSIIDSKDNSNIPYSCVVCLSQTIDAVLFDCGHAVLCWSCAQLIAKAPKPQCPICRLEIQQLLHISSHKIELSNGSIVAISDEGYAVKRHSQSVTVTTSVPGVIPGVLGHLDTFTTTVNNHIG
jgi:Zinc finger, C3HC4 type (RING finger)